MIMNIDNGSDDDDQQNQTMEVSCFVDEESFTGGKTSKQVTQEQISENRQVFPSNQNYLGQVIMDDHEYYSGNQTDQPSEECQITLQQYYYLLNYHIYYWCIRQRVYQQQTSKKKRYKQVTPRSDRNDVLNIENLFVRKCENSPEREEPHPQFSKNKKIQEKYKGKYKQKYENKYDQSPRKKSKYKNQKIMYVQKQPQKVKNMTEVKAKIETEIDIQKLANSEENNMQLNNSAQKEQTEKQYEVQIRQSQNIPECPMQKQSVNQNQKTISEQQNAKKKAEKDVLQNQKNSLNQEGEEIFTNEVEQFQEVELKNQEQRDEVQEETENIFSNCLAEEVNQNQQNDSYLHSLQTTPLKKQEEPSIKLLAYILDIQYKCCSVVKFKNVVVGDKTIKVSKHKKDKNLQLIQTVKKFHECPNGKTTWRLAHSTEQVVITALKIQCSNCWNAQQYTFKDQSLQTICMHCSQVISFQIKKVHVEDFSI